MPKTIQQKVVFKNCKAGSLYTMFLDSKHHTMLTGNSPAKISAREGARFTAHGGYCSGKNLQLLKDKLIVQSWRSADWSKDEPDSTLVLLFDQDGKDAVINMVHANVPDVHLKSIADGWKAYYWKPWQAYLKK